MRDLVFLNGELLERDAARVSVEDRGYQFADGVYEVTRFHGRKALRLDAHLQRLQRSCEGMRFAGTYTPEEWRGIIDRMVVECDLPHDQTERYVLYQQVTRGVFPRAHLFPKDAIRPTSVAYFRKAPLYDDGLRETGVALSTQEDERWAKCQIKTVCLLPAIWAKQAAVDAGAFEAMLVRNGNVTEGASTNMFCVKDGVLMTHPESGFILSGITREAVLRAAERAGIKVLERPVPVEEFVSADEIFICSTTLDVMPVTRVDDRIISNGRAGEVTRAILKAYGDVTAAELAD